MYFSKYLDLQNLNSVLAGDQGKKFLIAQSHVGILIAHLADSVNRLLIQIPLVLTICEQVPYLQNCHKPIIIHVNLQKSFLNHLVIKIIASDFCLKISNGSIVLDGVVSFTDDIYVFVV